MKNTAPRPPRPQPSRSTSPAHPDPDRTASRIALALLDDYVVDTGERKGYDPYDTKAMHRAARVWQTKPKRS